MNDPATSLNVLPPRYLLESDSEDEEGEGLYGTSFAQRPKINVQPLPVAVRWTDGARPYEHVVVAIGQASRYLKRKLGGSHGVLTIERGGDAVGQGVEVEGALVLHVDEEEGEGVWELARALREAIEASTWTVFTTYLPSMYIPSARSALPKRPPIRYLSTSPSPLESVLPKIESPNFTTGLPAALASLSVHPSTSAGSLTILSLPLPLSDISHAALYDAMAPVSSQLAGLIRSRSKSPAAGWEEKDDEPYSGPGMGARKRVAKKDVSREDISGMYM